MTLPLPNPDVTLRPGEQPSQARLEELFAFLQENLDVISLQLPVTASNLASRSLPVEALPTTNLFKGRRVLYVADKTNGLLWDLAYIGEGTLPWSKVGGPALFAEVTTEQTTASKTYVNLTTVGPSITVPLKGDYDVEVGCRYWNGSANDYGYMSYAIGGTAATDEDSASPMPYIPGGFGDRPRRKTGLAAKTELITKYRVELGNTGFFTKRWIRVNPTRVG